MLFCRPQLPVMILLGWKPGALCKGTGQWSDGWPWSCLFATLYALRPAPTQDFQSLTVDIADRDETALGAAMRRHMGDSFVEARPFDTTIFDGLVLRFIETALV